jgi:molybdopterin synthase sulfur carrier subunit
MTVTVKLFAQLKEVLGSDELQLSLPDGATAFDALQILKSTYPSVSGLDICAIAVNLEFAVRTTPLHDGDEVCFITPIAGG